MFNFVKNASPKVVTALLGALLVIVAIVGLSSNSDSSTAVAASKISTSVPIGVYHQVKSGIPRAIMTATVSDGSIYVLLKLDSDDEGDSDVTGTFWEGTFDAKDAPHIVSKPDQDKLDRSLLASSETTKTFTYANGELTFQFSIMGVSTTVHLEK